MRRSDLREENVSSPSAALGQVAAGYTTHAFQKHTFLISYRWLTQMSWEVKSNLLQILCFVLETE